MARDRYAELKRILEERRREIMSAVQDKIRDVRSEGANNPTHGVLDAAETSESDIQDDIEFALIQMKAETLHKIEEALRRLDENTFGYCFECGEEISERRLRALPFAVRCKDCEEAREMAQQRERVVAQRRGAPRSSRTCRASRARTSHAPLASGPWRRVRATFRRLRVSGPATPPPCFAVHRGSPRRFPGSLPRFRRRSLMSDRDDSLVVVDEASADRPLTIPPDLPVLPLRDTVLFPNSFMPLAVAREASVRLIDEATPAAG